MTEVLTWEPGKTLFVRIRGTSIGRAGAAGDELLNRFQGRLAKGFRIRMADNLSPVQKGDGVCQGEGQAQVMADNDRGYLEAPDRGVDQFGDGSGHDGIQTGGGLIKQQDFRFQSQGPGQGDAFAHAAGEFAGHLVINTAQPHLSLVFPGLTG